MAGFENDVVVAKNLNFDQDAPKPHLGVINAAGKLPIGTGDTFPTPEILGGSITSPGGTITVGYSSPNITLDVAGGGMAIDSVLVQTGTSPVVPNGSGEVTFNGATVAAGANPVRTNGTAANTYALEVQISQAIASTNANNIGLAAFNSADFTVDANGFVSAAPIWTEVTDASVNAAVGNGYILNNAGLLTVNLPATFAVGDEIRFCGKGAGLYVLDAPAGDTIHFGNQNTSSGGTVTATNRYDTIHILGTVADTEWTVLTSVGNFTIA